MNSTIKVFRISLIAIFIFLVGCAGSKSTVEPESTTPTQQDDYGEIEQLLGISPEEQQKATQQGDQDDLLQLLQANDGSEGAGTPTPQDRDSKVVQLESQVDRLNKKVQEKDKTISVLEAQLKAMEGSQPAAGKSAVYISGQPDMSDEEYEINYQHGYNLALNKQYKDAIQVFETLLAANTRHGLLDNAQYWIGECYYALGDYRAAIVAFEKVFTFKNSNKNDYAQYKLGLCYYSLNDRQRAREEFQSLIDNYKTPSLVSKAEQYIAKL